MTPMREAAMKALSGVKGAFLRCDRGGSLYVTNAPSRSEGAVDWSGYGFRAVRKGGLEFLWPEECWLKEFAMWAGEKVRQPFLTQSVSNASGGEIEKEDMQLWIDGVKKLEMRADAAGYEKMVRQRAAVVLREKKGGGTLAVCGLIADMMREGGYADED